MDGRGPAPLGGGGYVPGGGCMYCGATTERSAESQRNQDEYTRGI